MDHNILNNVFVSKFDTGGNVLYAKILWKHDEHDLFHIKIYDDNGYTWTGKCSNNFVTEHSECVVENEEVYRLNIKNALVGDQTPYTYDFIVGQSDDERKFQWRKKFEGGASVIYGYVHVHRDTPESKDELVNILLLQNRDLSNAIEHVTRKNKQIDEDLDRCKNELEKFVNIKTSLETSLYGKFVQLLNTKKRRIQLLEENLLKFEEPNRSSCDNELD